MKYLRKNNRTSSYEYRRRVPKLLESLVKKREFLKVLGKTQSDAIMRYGREHERVEHLIKLARFGVSGISPKEQSYRLAALLESWDADPDGPGVTENELTWRQEAAAELVDQYQDPASGEYVGVPQEKGAMAAALLSGVSRSPMVVTVTDAFKAYLEEKAHTVPEQAKKQRQRLARAEKNVIFVLCGDRSLQDVGREDARAWRDMRAREVSSATVRRERNDINAVFNWAISEMDGAGESNPFKALKLKGTTTGRNAQRLPLETSVIEAVYDDLQPHRDLLRIWTLLDHTGARDGEIRMLLASEVVLDHPVPHIVIQPRPDRTLKSS